MALSSDAPAVLKQRWTILFGKARLEIQVRNQATTSGDSADLKQQTLSALALPGMIFMTDNVSSGDYAHDNSGLTALGYPRLKTQGVITNLTSASDVITFVVGN